MSKLPIIKVDINEEDYEKEVDKLFLKLNIPEYIPNELIKIRKKQILNHHHKGRLIQLFKELLNFIGCKDSEYNRGRMKYIYDELIYLHTPIYLDLPFIVTEEYTTNHNWDEVSFIELYNQYYELVAEKGWLDYIRIYSMEDVYNYMILDILNDLVIHKKIISYDLHSFMENLDVKQLLKKYDDSLIKIKIKE